jgi:hypothetical protein
MSAAVANLPVQDGSKRPATPHASAATAGPTDTSLSAQLAELARPGRKVLEDRMSIDQRWRYKMGTTNTVGKTKEEVKPIYSTDTAAPTVLHEYERDGRVQDNSIKFSEHLIRGPGSAFGGTLDGTGRTLGDLSYQSKQGLSAAEGGWVKDGRGRGGTAPINTRKSNMIDRLTENYAEEHIARYKTGENHNPTAQVRYMSKKNSSFIDKYGWNHKSPSTAFESNQDRDQWLKALREVRREGGLSESEFRELYPVMSRHFTFRDADASYEGLEFVEEHTKMTKANHAMMIPKDQWDEFSSFVKMQSRPLADHELESRAIEMSATSGKGPMNKKLYGKLAIIPFENLSKARKTKFKGLDWDDSDDYFDTTVGDNRIMSYRRFRELYPLLDRHATVCDAEQEWDTDGPAGTGKLGQWCTEALDFNKHGTIVLAPDDVFHARSDSIRSADLSMLGDKLSGCLYDKTTCGRSWCQSHGTYLRHKPKGKKGSTWSIEEVQDFHDNNETKYDAQGRVTEPGFMAHAAPPGGTTQTGVRLDMTTEMRGTKAEQRARHAAAAKAASQTAATAMTAMTAGTAVTRTESTAKSAMGPSEMTDTTPPTAAATSAVPAKLTTGTTTTTAPTKLKQLTDAFWRWKGDQTTTAEPTTIPTTKTTGTAMDAPTAWGAASTAPPIAAF